jgi:RNA polymerase sigma-70 factor, ECF subfamily
LSAVDELTRLAQAARQGDAASLESFVRASYDQVWRFCAALADASAADDLAQETYARCVRSLRRFRGDASALTWVLSIARHVCASELRSRVRVRANTAANGPEDPDRMTVPDPAGEVTVADLFARLDPDRRAAFVLTQVLGLPYAEAAAVCGCPVGTIRSRVARAREDLIMMLSADETVSRGRRLAGGSFSS